MPLLSQSFQKHKVRVGLRRRQQKLDEFIELFLRGRRANVLDLFPMFQRKDILFYESVNDRVQVHEPFFQIRDVLSDSLSLFSVHGFQMAEWQLKYKNPKRKVRRKRH